VREWVEKKGLDVMILSPECKNSTLTCFLHNSSSLDWKNICLFLIEKGVRVNRQNKSGNTALTLMCQYGAFERVEFLVENRADVNFSGIDEITPLMFACSNRKDYARIIPYLISKGASIEDRDKYQRRSLDWAFQHDSNVFNTIIPYYSINARRMQNVYFFKSCADPYNCWVDAIKHGCIDLEKKSSFNGFSKTFNLDVTNYHHQVERKKTKRLCLFIRKQKRRGGNVR
jgi:hypothetical protein